MTKSNWSIKVESQFIKTKFIKLPMRVLSQWR